MFPFAFHYQSVCRLQHVGRPLVLACFEQSLSRKKSVTYGVCRVRGVSGDGTIHTRIVCMDVCMYACMYVCMYVRMYAVMYVCTHVCMHVCMYVCAAASVPSNVSLPQLRLRGACECRNFECVLFLFSSSLMTSSVNSGRVL